MAFYEASLELFRKTTLNLLSVEGGVDNACDALQSMHDILFASSYLSTFEATLSDLDIMNTFDHDQFKRSAQAYILAIVQNLKNRFPQARLLTLLGYFDPKNVEKATLFSMIEKK